MVTLKSENPVEMLPGGNFEPVLPQLGSNWRVGGGSVLPENAGLNT